jgi:hypothetical protein
MKMDDKKEYYNMVPLPFKRSDQSGTIFPLSPVIPKFIEFSEHYIAVDKINFFKLFLDDVEESPRIYCSTVSTFLIERFNMVTEAKDRIQEIMAQLAPSIKFESVSVTTGN